MKYKDLIQFEPINEVVKFDRLGEDDYRKGLVRNFVFSKAYEETIIPRICENLDYSQTYRPFQADMFSSFDTFGIQIVGNYGTGKSHLMSIFSLIAEDASYLDMVSNAKAKEALGAIAGKYKVIRFELGNDQELWDIVCYRLDQGFQKMGINYSITADKSNASYGDKLDKAMAQFEAKYPNHGLMIIVDEMLEYLKGRSQPGNLDRDLSVLRTLGQKSDNSKFRMVFGVQELIYNVPEFQFAATMLQHANDRYIPIQITKQDVQYVVQHRLLKKTDEQKAAIKNHLSKFTSFFTDMHANIDDYVDLFPVNPSYFDNFQRIQVAKAQREILKTLTQKFQRVLDDEVPTQAPGLICYDSYWDDLKVSDMQTDPDVRKVTEVMSTIYQKIDDNFRDARAKKAPLAKRIANACAIKILQFPLDRKNGVSAENLVDDLCYLDATCMDREMLQDVIGTTAQQIVTATVGQFFEKSEENQEFHLRIEGGVNYEQKIKDYASQMSDDVKDAHFFNFLVEFLPIETEQYRREFKIFQHKIDWKSHKMMLDGYIFMGNPSERSTTHPEQNFYIYFMPIFNKKAIQHGDEADSIYVHLDKVSQEMKEKLTLLASAEALIAGAPTNEKKFYEQFKRSYQDQLKPVFNRDFVSCTEIVYQGVVQNITPAMMQGGSKEQVISNIASTLLEDFFCQKLPNYPKFALLSQPLTTSNIAAMLKGARQKIANPTISNRNSEAILAGLGLLHENKLNIENSIYAQSIKSKLDAKGEGQVLNRDEILYRFWEDCYRTTDFDIDASFEFLVLAAMVGAGEIEIDFSQGVNINATNLRDIIDYSNDKFYSFSHIRHPRGMNLPAVRELFMGIVGIDMTSRLNDESVYSRLVTDAQTLAAKLVETVHKIKPGVKVDDVEILSSYDATTMCNKMDALRGLCDQMVNYNTQARMRNLRWTAEQLRGVFEAKTDLDNALKILKFAGDIKSKISYLNQAKQYIIDEAFIERINKAIEKVSKVAEQKDNEQAVRAYVSELDALANEYADWYIDRYDKLHITELEYAEKVRIQRSDKKVVCDTASDEDFVTISTQYTAWENKMSELTVKQSSVNKEAVLNVPYQNFNPRNFIGQQLPKLEDLREELDDIYDKVDKSLHAILCDQNLIQNAADALDDSEKRTMEKFKNESTTPQNVSRIIEIIQKLHKGINKIEISQNDIREIFTRPMSPSDAIAAFKAFINRLASNGDDDTTRIILK